VADGAAAANATIDKRTRATFGNQTNAVTVTITPEEIQA